MSDLSSLYSFKLDPCEQDAGRWKGVFITSLRKVHCQISPNNGIVQDALDYVEELISKLLESITCQRIYSIADVEQYVQRTFPDPVNAWAVNSAHEVVTKSSKRNKDKPILPWRDIQSILMKDKKYKLDNQVAMYIAAILEYIAFDILKLTGNFVNNIRHTEITVQDLKVAMTGDTLLMDLFFPCDEEKSIDNLVYGNTGGGAHSQTEDYGSRTKTAPNTYEATVKDLIHEETQYLRDVNMIVLVFRNNFQRVKEELSSASPNPIDLDVIFSNILDIREFTTRFLGVLEEAVEMTREGAIPEIGCCFSEMAQTNDFAVYETYLNDMVQPQWLEHLNYVLSLQSVKEQFDRLQAGFRMAAKYVLPKLLHVPIFHCLKYFEYISILKTFHLSNDDTSDLRDTECYLLPLKTRFDISSPDLLKRNLSGRFQFRLSGHNHAALAKIQELSKIEGWEGKVDGKNCSEFMFEGPLDKLNTMQPNKLAMLGPGDTLRANRSQRTTERYVFLFDSLIVLCKLSSQSSRRPGGGGGVGANDYSKYKVKEHMQIRRLEVVDREDTEELKHVFELRPKDNQPPIVLIAQNEQIKQNWLAPLVMLQTRSMLERKLDASLGEEEKSIPLLMPSVDQYKFAEEDLENVNIKFENYSSSSGLPIIKAATVVKLIERLTHHQQVDPNFTKMFLMTYRSFLKPKELLTFLIERFDIRDPTLFDSHSNRLNAGLYSNGFGGAGGGGDPSSPLADSDVLMREALKKFRKKYAQPIQIRVLNVMRHWVDDHWYDFEQDPTLVESFNGFLKRVENYKQTKKWVKNLLTIIVRKTEATQTGESLKSNAINFNADPPPFEWHLTKSPENYDLMTLHPVEIARQVTLLEFELYRAVKPVELVDAAWTKKDKSRSPQLTKLMKYSTNFNYWLQTCILECGNIDERVAVMNRILEIMQVFDELNNFNGIVEIHGMMQSAAIYRLDFTKEKLDKNLWRKFQEVQDENDRRYDKIKAKLKNINPPCVPFFGFYLTDLNYVNEAGMFFTPNNVDEQNQQHLPEVVDSTTQMINVVKCRKTAKIISDIQLYQHQPYCLHVEPTIRHIKIRALIEQSKTVLAPWMKIRHQNPFNINFW